MQDFQNIINKQGKLHLPMKIFKSKVFLTDEYLPWDPSNFFFC